MRYNKKIKYIILSLIFILTSCTTKTSYLKHSFDDTITVSKVNFGYSIIPNCYEMTEGLIFYPGGKVTPEAYIPLLTKLANVYQIAIFIPKMPFNLAIFNKNAAKKILEEYSYITNWSLAGHSLGGVMASSFIYENPNIFKGLILLASYPENKKPLTNYNLNVLSIIGSEDKVINLDNFNNAINLLPKSSEFNIIEGGNHAQFGSYGIQKRDGIATINQEEQQSLTVNLISNFLSSNY